MQAGDKMHYTGQPGRKPVVVEVVNVGKLITVRFPSGKVRVVSSWRLSPVQEAL
jgi:hypothetical protein